MRRRKVIIVGAGVGGLATALLLAKKGMDVVIYEKTGQPGGRCQRIVCDGHVFDTGPTMYLFPEVFEEFFRLIGEDIGEYVTLLPVDPRYRLNFPDGTHLCITSDRKRMEAQLERIEPGSFRQYIRYLEDGKGLYRLAMDRMMDKPLFRAREYFTFSNLSAFLKTGALIPHLRYVNRYFRHPNLASAFTFQDSYLSLHPASAPAICSLFVYGEHAFGSWLPKGGMYAVVEALVSIAKKYGVRIVYGEPVKNIVIRKGAATGVLLESGEETADVVVVNADMTYAYTQLLPGDPYARTLQRKRRTSSAIVYHWCMNRVYPQLETHNLFFADPYHKGFDRILFGANPPEFTHFYVQAPARTDASRAPKGKDTLSVMVPINHIRANRPVDWNAYADAMRVRIVARLESCGMKGFGGHILHETRFLPTDWQAHLNLYMGSVYGVHHGVGALGYLRPKRWHRVYGNVFFVGADTHPGSSLPTVLRSAQYTYRKLIHALQL